MSQHATKTLKLVFTDEMSPTEERLHAQTTAMGASLSDEQFGQVFVRVCQLYELKQNVYFEEIQAIVDEIRLTPENGYVLTGVQITLGSSLIPSATVGIKNPEGKQILAEASGNSSIDAIFSAIQQALGVRVFLNDFNYGNISHGINSLGKATIELEHHGQEVTARACSTDILEAATKAFLIAVNIILNNRKEQF